MIGRRPHRSRDHRTTTPPFAPSSHRLRTTARCSRDDLIVFVPRPRLFARSSHDDPACSPDDRTPNPSLRAIIVRRPRCSPDHRTTTPLSPPRSHGFRASTPRSAPDRVRPRRSSCCPLHRAPAPLRPAALRRPRDRDQSAAGAPYDPSTRCPLEAHAQRGAPFEDGAAAAKRHTTTRSPGARMGLGSGGGRFRIGTDRSRIGWGRASDRSDPSVQSRIARGPGASQRRGRLDQASV